jgi:hypothetical protein
MNVWKLSSEHHISPQGPVNEDILRKLDWDIHQDLMEGFEVRAIDDHGTEWSGIIDINYCTKVPGGMWEIDTDHIEDFEIVVRDVPPLASKREQGKEFGI